jgi:hypothetical protein
MYQDLSRHAGKFYGKYSGAVVDNQDVDYLGRIKVSVPSVFGAATTVTARPCLPARHFFIPDIGDQVWIEFEGGDVRYPIWVGVWWVKDKVPAEAQVSPPDNRVIQTPSGHTIEIMDKTGDERVVIRHKSNAAVTLDKDGGVTVANANGSQLVLDAKDGKAEWTEEHGNVVTMDFAGVTITQAKSAVKIEMTDDTVHVTAPKIVLDASTSLACGANAMEPAVLGQTFASMWNLFINHTHPSALGPTGTPLPPGQPLSPGAGLAQITTVI